MSAGSEEIRLEVRIKASQETVFALLTDPARMKTWFAEFVEADPRPGGLFRISGPAGVAIEGTTSKSFHTAKWCSPGVASKVLSLDNRRWNSCSSRMVRARSFFCATTDCLDGLSNPTGRGGSSPDWPSSRTPRKGVGRPGYA